MNILFVGDIVGRAGRDLVKKGLKALVVEHEGPDLVGEPVALPPAEVLSIGGLLDLDEFRLQASACRPSMLNWLTTTTPALSPAQLESSPEGEGNDMVEYVELAKDRQLVRAA